jgi:hypothetical protein
MFPTVTPVAYRCIHTFLAAAFQVPEIRGILAAANEGG